MYSIQDVCNQVKTPKATIVRIQNPKTGKSNSGYVMLVFQRMHLDTGNDGYVGMYS